MVGCFLTRRSSTTEEGLEKRDSMSSLSSRTVTVDRPEGEVELGRNGPEKRLV